MLRSGNTRTVARPATGDVGAFSRATSGITAASYCNGPSIARSGRRCLAILVASITFSTSSPEPLVPVEYDNIATRAGMPNAIADSALWMAMSASSGAVGFGTTAQSPNTSTWSGRHMKKMLDTRLQPGCVLMICRAGRIVCAVLCTAPDTRPSASSSASIIVPSMIGSCSSTTARSGVMPLLLRRSTSGATYRSSDAMTSTISTEGGSTTPCFSATSWISSGFPSSTHLAIPRDATMAAASTVRGSAPSGSTIRLRSARAASTRRCLNAGGDRRGTRCSIEKRLTHSTSTQSATAFIVRSTRSASSTGMPGSIEAMLVTAR